MGDGARLEVHPGEVRHLAGNGENHVRHIYEKCDVHNRAELMRKLEEAG